MNEKITVTLGCISPVLGMLGIITAIFILLYSRRKKRKDLWT